MLSDDANQYVIADAVRFVPDNGPALTIPRTVAADAVRSMTNDAEAAHYVHADHLGTPQKMTDQAGALAWDRVALPFGETWSAAGPRSTSLRFPGQLYDPETGLHYNYFRDYDPATGRYIESDPIGLEGGINTYAYVGGDPITFADSDGLARNKNPRAKFRLVNCPAKEMAECREMCKCRGGVKSCKVTKGSRATIRSGEPLREIYIVPGSMNCVCNRDDPEPESGMGGTPLIIPSLPRSRPGFGGGGRKLPFGSPIPDSLLY